MHPLRAAGISGGRLARAIRARATGRSRWARAPPDEWSSPLCRVPRRHSHGVPSVWYDERYRRREPTQKRYLSLRRDLDANPNQIIFPRPNVGTVPSWRSDLQRVRFVGVSFQQRRGYRSDAEVETQYRKLFAACDVDENSIVTMGELQKTLFRFGLNKLGTSTLERLFRERALSESPTAVAETAPPSSPDARGEQALEEFQGAGLDFHQFVDFVEHAVELKTVLDREIPQGTSPLWWRKFKRELGFYKVSFSLLGEQTINASCVFDHGRNLSRNERRLVWISVMDFVKVLPLLRCWWLGRQHLHHSWQECFPSMLPPRSKFMPVAVQEDLDNSSNKARATVRVSVGRRRG